MGATQHDEPTPGRRPPTTPTPALVAGIVLGAFGIAGLAYGIVVFATYSPDELARVTEGTRALTRVFPVWVWALVSIVVGAGFTTGAVVAMRNWWRARR